MEKQIMKYSKEVTETHRLSCQHKDCLQLISDCFTQEGGKGNLFCQNETCINLDKIEKKQHKNSPQATMDITIGIEASSKKMLLVELRFNYKNPKNIGKQEILDKIVHSKDLLSDCAVHSEYIFIFKENVKNQARSHFNRLFIGKKTPCIIMTEDEFHHYFFL